MNFKVGDRVRYTREDSPFINKDEIGTVMEIKEDMFDVLWETGKMWYADGENLEHVTWENEEEKKMIKVGSHVTGIPTAVDWNSFTSLRLKYPKDGVLLVKNLVDDWASCELVSHKIYPVDKSQNITMWIPIEWLQEIEEPKKPEQVLYAMDSTVTHNLEKRTSVSELHYMGKTFYGSAKCHETDIFDPNKGATIANLRATIKALEYELEELTVKKDCSTCKYGACSPFKDPCLSCMASKVPFSKWEGGEKIPPNPDEKEDATLSELLLLALLSGRKK